MGENSTSDPSAGTPLPFSAISAQLGFLKGEILTIVEAVLSDKEQRKAVKDLVRDKFSGRERHLAKLCNDGSQPGETISTLHYRHAIPIRRPEADGLEAQGWEAWLATMAPHVFRGTHAPFHRAFWDWYWPLLIAKRDGVRLGEHSATKTEWSPLSYLLTLGRGLGTSTTVEWANIAAGCLLGRPLLLHGASTKQLALGHLTCIRGEIEDSQVAKYYPGMANPEVGKFDNRYGWGGDLLATASGFTILAVGLEQEIHGVKKWQLHPSLISVWQTISRLRWWVNAGR